MAAVLTQVTIWIAMLAWTIAILRNGCAWWAIGLAFYIAHIFAAYESHYQWSHEVAVLETARQTAEATGWNSGLGLYINYAFGVVLAVDLGVLFFRDRRPVPRLVDGLVFFMILNGSVVFGNGAVRIYGALLCVLIVANWIVRARESSSPAPFRPE